MGSKVYTSTEITDLRQAAEGEIVTGVGSQLALPGGIAAGEGATVSITGATGLDAGKTLEQMLDASQSSLGQVLGLTSQLAGGLFAQTPTGQQAIAAFGPSAGVSGGIDNKILVIGGFILLLFLMSK